MGAPASVTVLQASQIASPTAEILANQNVTYENAADGTFWQSNGTTLVATTVAGLSRSAVFGPTAQSIIVSTSVTITAANAAAYNGQALEVTAALTITLSAGLPIGFGFAVIPPATGNVSIVSDGTALLNGATTTLTRAASANAMFAVVQRASAANSYVVSGS